MPHVRLGGAGQTNHMAGIFMNAERVAYQTYMGRVGPQELSLSNRRQ
jgi:hypothetical protein